MTLSMFCLVIAYMLALYGSSCVLFLILVNQLSTNYWGSVYAFEIIFLHNTFLTYGVIVFVFSKMYYNKLLSPLK